MTGVCFSAWRRCKKHTHTHREREREREKGIGGKANDKYLKNLNWHAPLSIYHLVGEEPPKFFFLSFFPSFFLFSILLRVYFDISDMLIPSLVFIPLTDNPVTPKLGPDLRPAGPVHDTE